MSNVSSKHKYPEQYKAANWGPWRGLLMVVASFIGGQAVAVLLTYLPLAFGVEAHDLAMFFDTTFGRFISIAMAYGLSGFFLWLFLRQRKSSNWASVGFTRTWAGRDIGYGLLAFVVYLALFIAAATIIGGIFPIDATQEQETGFNEIFSRIDLLMAFVSLVLLPPFVEEVLFRGVLFGGMRRRYTFWWATLWTSLAFAAPHLLEAKSGGLLWIAGVDTLVLSVVLCYLREKTGSLWASIVLHMAKNCVAFFSLFIFVR